MNSGVFLRFLQDEYLNLLGREQKKSSFFRIKKADDAPISFCYIPPAEFRKFIGIEADICAFKDIVTEMLKKEKIHIHDGTEIPAADYFYHKALEKSKVPPFNPLYPFLISIMKLFNEDEIKEYFGIGYLNSYRRMVAAYGTL